MTLTLDFGQPLSKERIIANSSIATDTTVKLQNSGVRAAASRLCTEATESNWCDC